ncbi:uncharacterized protein LOC121048878 [Rosa chinensis]|uniref:uncharacterized protein LOC121048878 n=1 Tax=Rosa chinensis TaxID=74649 RepID=UPI001AD8CA67|nr:uncharacterized protein LOC121048878 [Rosa chinensis]
MAVKHGLHRNRAARSHSQLRLCLIWRLYILKGERFVLETRKENKQRYCQVFNNRFDDLASEVDPANVRPIQEGAVNALLEAEKVVEATKQAIKRKIAQAASVDFQSRSLPAKLRIEPDDPEDVKIAKRKKIHAFKSKMRMEQLEVTQNKRQNA